MNRILPILLIAALLTGCSLPAFGPSATATATFTPSPLPSPTASATPEPTVTSAPTFTPLPVDTPAIGGLSTLRSTPFPVPTDDINSEKVIVFLVKVGDGGAAGPIIGCNDSLVPVEVAVQPYIDSIRAALTALFSLGQGGYGDLYNGLYLSDLTFASVSIEGSRAVVRISGQVLSPGVCADPMILNQIRQTVLFQNPLLREVTILLGGRDLQDILSLRGK